MIANYIAASNIYGSQNTAKNFLSSGRIGTSKTLGAHSTTVKSKIWYP